MHKEVSIQITIRYPPVRLGLECISISNTVTAMVHMATTKSDLYLPVAVFQARHDHSQETTHGPTDNDRHQLDIAPDGTQATPSQWVLVMKERRTVMAEVGKKRTRITRMVLGTTTRQGTVGTTCVGTRKTVTPVVLMHTPAMSFSATLDRTVWYATRRPSARKCSKNVLSNRRSKGCQRRTESARRKQYVTGPFLTA